jgi:hypothetical protein
LQDDPPGDDGRALRLGRVPGRRDDTATATLQNGTLIDKVGLADNCPTASAIVLTGTPTLTVDHSQLTNIASAAICVRNGPNAAIVHVVSSTIDKAVSGIASEIGSGSVATVTLTSSSVTNGSNGINWAGLAGSTFTLSAATLTGNQTGITFDGAGSLKLRGSSVSSSTDTGVALYSTVTADLGTTADPGLNTFTGNTNVGLKDKPHERPHVAGRRQHLERQHPERGRERPLLDVAELHFRAQDGADQRHELLDQWGARRRSLRRPGVQK